MLNACAFIDDTRENIYKRHLTKNYNPDSLKWWKYKSIEKNMNMR